MRFKTSIFMSCVFSVLMVTGCESHEGPTLPDHDGQQSESVPRVVEVETSDVEAQPIQRPVSATGSTQAARAANVGAEMSGTITHLLVEEGSRVEEGDIMARLDGRTASLAASQARAMAAAARAQTRQLQTDADRLNRLAENGVVAQAEADRLQSQRDAVRRQQEASEAAARLAGHQVTNSVVRAPFSGTISTVMLEVGEMASMMPPQPIVRLLDLSEIEVRVRVTERGLARINEGDRVQARIPSLGADFNGQVTHVGLEIHPLTRTAEVITTFPNPEGRLRAGMFAEVEIHPTEERTGLVLPRSAIGGNDEESYVYVISGCQAQRRTVSFRALDGGRVEISEGVTAGETIVTRGVPRLTDGARIDAGDADDCSPAVAARQTNETPTEAVQ